PEDQGRDDHLDQAEEQLAEQPDVIGPRGIDFVDVCAQRDAQRQTDEDLLRQPDTALAYRAVAVSRRLIQAASSRADRSPVRCSLAGSRTRGPEGRSNKAEGRSRTSKRCPRQNPSALAFCALHSDLAFGLVGG